MNAPDAIVVTANKAKEKLVAMAKAALSEEDLAEFNKMLPDIQFGDDSATLPSGEIVHLSMQPVEPMSFSTSKPKLPTRPHGTRSWNRAMIAAMFAAGMPPREHTLARTIIPPTPQTPERLAAAQAKRERKAAKRLKAAQ